MDRLDHHGPVPGHEGADFLHAARHQSRRHEAPEIEHEDLLRRIAHTGRVVDHQRFRLDPLQQVGRGDVAHVERRVLPHQDHIDVAAKVEPAKFALCEMIARDALDGDGMSQRMEPVVLVQRQAADIVMEQRMAARLRRQHQGERGIARDIDRMERVHLDRDAQGHFFYLRSP